MDRILISLSERGNVRSNFIVTGRPGCGKTTVLEKLAERLRDRGYTVGGIICPEIRDRGRRMGFEIIDLLGRSGTLSHVRLADSGVPMVSRYGVNMDDLSDISREAFERQPEVFVVDEIGPMEIKSQVFTKGVGRILDSGIPVAASIHHRISEVAGLRIRKREDTAVMNVTRENRDRLPQKMEDEIVEVIVRRGGNGGNLRKDF